MITLYGILPPIPSGIALYVRDLIRAWGPAQLSLRLDGGECSVEFDARPFDAPAEGVPVYMLGNHPFHEQTWKLATQQPGVVVLHDLNLHHMVHACSQQQGDEARYRSELCYELGPELGRATFERLRTLTGTDLHHALFDVPVLARVLDRARLVVVHEERQRRWLACRYPGLAVEVVAHGISAEPVRSDGPGPIPRKSSRPLVVVAGALSSTRGLDQILAASQSAGNPQLVFCGRPDPSLPADAFGGHRLIENPSDEVFLQVLEQADLLVNIRTRTVGETSGTTLRAHAVGTPVAMTEGTGEPIHPSLAIPKHGSEESLGRLFERLEAEPDTFKAWGNRARALVDSEHSLEHWAARLRDVILAAPAQNRLQRRARVLDGLSADLTHWAPSLGWHTQSTQIS